MIVVETPNFTIHAIDGYIETLYLVVYSDKLLLLDGGCRCDAKDVVDYILGLRRPMEELKLIVVTHPHPDHSGAAPTLHRQYGVAIAAIPVINEWYRGFNGWLTQKTDIFLTYYVAQKKGKQFKHLRFPRHTPITHPLSNGMHLPFFTDWQILSTPGHTKMDVSIYHEKESIAYVADLLIGLGKRYSTPYPISDPIQYRKSLQMMKELKIKYILLAHHGMHEVAVETWDTLIQTVGDKPKNHLNAIRKWLPLL